VSSRRVAIAFVGLLAGTLASCLAAQIENGFYESVYDEPGESATLTVDGDRVILEYTDDEGSAYVEYEVVDVRCHPQL